MESAPTTNPRTGADAFNPAAWLAPPATFRWRFVSSINPALLATAPVEISLACYSRFGWSNGCWCDSGKAGHGLRGRESEGGVAYGGKWRGCANCSPTGKAGDDLAIVMAGRCLLLVLASPTTIRNVAL